MAELPIGRYPSPIPDLDDGVARACRGYRWLWLGLVLSVAFIAHDGLMAADAHALSGRATAQASAKADGDVHRPEPLPRHAAYPWVPSAAVGRAGEDGCDIGHKLVKSEGDELDGWPIANGAAAVGSTASGLELSHCSLLPPGTAPPAKRRALLQVFLR